jgi:hypothetical protein
MDVALIIQNGYHERKGTQATQAGLGNDAARAGGGARTALEHTGACGAGRDTSTEDRRIRGEIPSTHEKKNRRVKVMAGLGRTYLRGKRWWISYYFRGHEQREPAHSTNENDAIKLLKKRPGEIGRGRVMVNEEKVTFAEMAADFQRDYETTRSGRCARLSSLCIT